VQWAVLGRGFCLQARARSGTLWSGNYHVLFRQTFRWLRILLLGWLWWGCSI